MDFDLERRKHFLFEVVDLWTRFCLDFSVNLKHETFSFLKGRESEPESELDVNSIKAITAVILISIPRLTLTS